MKDYIELSKLSEIVITLSVIYDGSPGRIAKKYKFKELKDITPTRENFPHNGGCFRKCTSQPADLLIILYRIEFRSSKTSDELRACIEKA